MLCAPSSHPTPPALAIPIPVPTPMQPCGEALLAADLANPRHPELIFLCLSALCMSPPAANPNNTSSTRPHGTHCLPTCKVHFNLSLSVSLCVYLPVPTPRSQTAKTHTAPPPPTCRAEYGVFPALQRVSRLTL